ncbi:hypothetical protein [Psychromonas marina]
MFFLFNMLIAISVIAGVVGGLLGVGAFLSDSVGGDLHPSTAYSFCCSRNQKIA